MKILLVEDEPLIQKSLKALLVRKGCEVDVEASGKKAILKIENTDYDRIICDLMLQDITGFDVIEESKKRYTIKEIGGLFIIITAYSSDQVLDRASKYGCKVLSKPFEDLNKALEIFISTERSS